MEKLICKKCGKTCTEDDYNEFQELCLECDEAEIKEELSHHYNSVYETLFENLITI